MLTIRESDAVISRLAPKEDHAEDEVHYAMDCRVVIAVQKGAREALMNLRVPELAKAMWDRDGKAALGEAQIKLRHKIPNVKVTLGNSADQPIEFVADISQVKLTAMDNNSVEFDCKLKGHIDPQAYIAIWGMKIDGNAYCSMEERQLSIDDMASG